MRRAGWETTSSWRQGSFLGSSVGYEKASTEGYRGSLGTGVDSQSVPTGRPLPFLRHPSRAFRPMSSLLSYHYRPSTAASRLGRLGARQAWIANRGLPGVPLPSPLSALGTHFDASVAFILDRPA